MVEFTKPALSLDAQVQLLLTRGMEGEPAKMKRRLGVVSYYRLSGYWFHRKRADSTFEPGTRFESAWEQYVFDRKLRLLALDAIERIEVALRTQFAYEHANQFGPFAYATNARSLPSLTALQHEKLLTRVRDDVARSKELFVEHFADKYGDKHQLPPIWMATEVMSMGSIVTLWQSSPNTVKNRVAATFGVSDSVLRSWLWSLNEVRNICAHHGRLWNRELGNKPTIPHERHHPDWHKPPMSNRRVFAVLSVCAHSLARIAPSSAWRQRVVRLVHEHPHIPTTNMGFPTGWEESRLWSTSDPT